MQNNTIFFYNGIYFWYKWNRCNTLNNTAPLNIDWILILKTETQEILGLTLGIKCDIEFCLCVFVCSCRTEVYFVIFTWYSGILLDCSPGATKLEFSLPRNWLRIQVLYDPPIYKYIYISSVSQATLRPHNESEYQMIQNDYYLIEVIWWMDTGIHNACHLMNIAHCMQLPDLQYELKHTISCTLYSSLPVMCTSCSSFLGGGHLTVSHFEKKNTLRVRFKDYSVVPPGGQSLNLLQM